MYCNVKRNKLLNNWEEGWIIGKKKQQKNKSQSTFSNICSPNKRHSPGMMCYCVLTTCSMKGRSNSKIFTCRIFLLSRESQVYLCNVQHLCKTSCTAYPTLNLNWFTTSQSISQRSTLKLSCHLQCAKGSHKIQATEY